MPKNSKTAVVVKRPQGRPPYAPSDEHRRIVEQAVAWGISRPVICRSIINSETGEPISTATLEKYFYQELEHGSELVKRQLAGFLFDAAAKGNTYASMYLLRTRHKWYDQQERVPAGNPRLNAPLNGQAGGGGVLIIPADSDPVAWEKATLEAQAKLVTSESETEL